MKMPNVRAPWLKHYGSIPASLHYPDVMMVDMVERISHTYPSCIAYDFMGRQATFSEFVTQIHRCARALCATGIGRGDKVLICLPNVPQAIILFYALNRIGAIPHMLHPLSSEGEIAACLKSSGCVAAITLNQFYQKFAAAREDTNLKILIIARIRDMLSVVKKVGFSLTKGRAIRPIPESADVLYWNDLMARGESFTGEYCYYGRGDDPAAVLYSGGTTGTTKGVLLTNLNFNALGLQTAAACDCLSAGHKMLAIMPIFHGFGLGVCIHTVLIAGARCILVPQFTPATYAALLKKHKPNYIAGVPTLFEALLRLKNMDKLDLSSLEGVFCGGDSLSVELKSKVDAFLRAHGATVQIREGYGTTECVTASCLTPKDFYVKGSIGIPFPDTFYKIVTPATQDEVPYGQIGEICISGPSVMKEYVGNPKETAAALQLHADGLLWLHTGDLGSMDEDGFVYFKQRLKRMIVSSGYNIYPSQVENVIDAHPDVLMSTVIGVRDDYKMQKVKAFVVLRPGVQPTEAVKASVFEHCRKNIVKYAMPYTFEFRDSLPKTLVGKVAYTVLEAEEAARRGKQDA